MSVIPYQPPEVYQPQWNYMYLEAKDPVKHDSATYNNVVIRFEADTWWPGMTYISGTPFTRGWCKDLNVNEQPSFELEEYNFTLYNDLQQCVEEHFEAFL